MAMMDTTSFRRFPSTGGTSGGANLKQVRNTDWIPAAEVTLQQWSLLFGLSFAVNRGRAGRVGRIKRNRCGVTTPHVTGSLPALDSTPCKTICGLIFAEFSSLILCLLRTASKRLRIVIGTFPLASKILNQKITKLQRFSSYMFIIVPLQRVLTTAKRKRWAIVAESIFKAWCRIDRCFLES